MTCDRAGKKHVVQTFPSIWFWSRAVLAQDQVENLYDRVEGQDGKMLKSMSANGQRRHMPHYGGCTKSELQKLTDITAEAS